MKYHLKPMLTFDEVDTYLIQKEMEIIDQQIKNGKSIDQSLHMKNFKKELEAMHPMIRLKLYDEVQIRDIEERRSESWSCLDKLRFFNRASAIADFDHYLDKVTWTKEEAVALCFGKNPKVVNFNILNEYVNDIEHDPNVQYSAFIKDYFDVRDILLSDPDVSERGSPVFFLVWFNKNKIVIDDNLQKKAVMKKIISYSEYNWIEEEFINALRGDDEVGGDMDNIKPLAKKVNSNNLSGNDVVDFSPKSKTSYLRIIGALLSVIEGTMEGVKPHPQYRNLSAFISLLEEKYYKNGIGGLSESHLSHLFPIARKELNNK